MIPATLLLIAVAGLILVPLCFILLFIKRSKEDKQERQLGFGVYSLTEGFIYLILAIFVQKKSLGAIILATCIYGLGNYMELSAVWLVNKFIFFTMLPMRLIFFSFLLGGIRAIRALNNTKD
jgi:hypothetical protein